MSDATQDAEVHADGSATFDETPPVESDGGFTGESGENELPVMEEAKFAVDPAIFLLIGVAIVIGLYYFFVVKRKKVQDDDDIFFADLDGKKFDIELPSEVDEYYKIRAKCEELGWIPGVPENVNADAQNKNGPGRVLAQALMKRAMADIPLVQHIQKESHGMGKLYSKSMCSVNQWRAFQAAEAMVGAEVEQVRAEADELEPGWSEVIWQQAVQYHQMLKQKHEAEAKQQAAKLKNIVAAAASSNSTSTSKPASPIPAAKPASKEDEVKARELAAQKAAEELLKEEEREKNAKKAFAAGGGVKKGFLDGKGKKK
ncbi:hypothetical protein MPSEU_000522700 [Mayamaea pseudoterrestris]|nr:hypothetical protein MPSEU_000522700 [Mayamaea pseudoterrestris]